MTTAGTAATVLIVPRTKESQGPAVIGACCGDAGRGGGLPGEIDEQVVQYQGQKGRAQDLLLPTGSRPTIPGRSEEEEESVPLLYITLHTYGSLSPVSTGGLDMETEIRQPGGGGRIPPPLASHL